MANKKDQKRGPLSKRPGIRKGDPYAKENTNRLLAGYADGLTDMLPVVGDAKSLNRAREAYNEGNYGTAATELGTTALGYVPVAGPLAKVGKAAHKAKKATKAATNRFNAKLLEAHGKGVDVRAVPTDYQAVSLRADDLSNPNAMKDATIPSRGNEQLIDGREKYNVAYIPVENNALGRNLGYEELEHSTGYFKQFEDPRDATSLYHGSPGVGLGEEQRAKLAAASLGEQLSPSQAGTVAEYAQGYLNAWGPLAAKEKDLISKYGSDGVPLGHNKIDSARSKIKGGNKVAAKERADYMASVKKQLKADSGDDYEVLFHSSPMGHLDADNFRYRPVNIPTKSSHGQGPGVFTHGYDQDYDDVFGKNVYAVVYDKRNPTYAGKMDDVSGIDEIFVPQKSVGEIVKVWDGAPVKYNVGGLVPQGYHIMPDGSIMPDSAHYNSGGLVRDPQTGEMVSYSELSKRLQMRHRQGMMKQQDVPDGMSIRARNPENTRPASDYNLQRFNAMDSNGNPIGPLGGQPVSRKMPQIDPVSPWLSLFMNEGGQVPMSTQMLPQVQEALVEGYNKGGSVGNPYEGLKKGAFTAQAGSRGMTPAQFQSKVLSNPDAYSETTRKRAQWRKNFAK